jgi:hypothetical protein
MENKIEFIETVYSKETKIGKKFFISLAKSTEIHSGQERSFCIFRHRREEGDVDIVIESGEIEAVYEGMNKIFEKINEKSNEYKDLTFDFKDRFTLGCFLEKGFSTREVFIVFKKQELFLRFPSNELKDIIKALKTIAGK